MIVTIAPCSNCWHTDPEVTDTEDGYIEIECPGCKRKLCGYRTELAAILAWNERNKKWTMPKAPS